MHMNKPEIYSFSKLNTVEQCEYQYKLHYIDGVESRQNWFGRVGNDGHEVLESYFKGEIKKEDMSRAYALKKYDRDVPPPFPKIEPKWDGQILDYFDNFQPPKTQVLGVEEEFYVKFKHFWFRGYIDLVTLSKDGDIYIIDHKIADPEGDSWDTDKKIIQLYLYSAYIYIKFGKFPKKLIFNMFRVGKYIVNDFEMKKFEEAINWMYKQVDKIKQIQIYNANYNKFFCENLCGVNHACKFYTNPHFKEFAKQLT